MSQDGVPDSNVRASDADRERIVEQLRQHTADGRLTMDEFEERMSAAYAARTYGELAQLTRDLPVDLAARQRGSSSSSSGVPPWQGSSASGSTTPLGGRGTGFSDTSPGDVVSALVGAAMDFKLQSRQMRDQLRSQRHEQRHQLRQARHHGPLLVTAVAGWASLSVLLTGVWFIAGITDDNGFGQFWPAWPIGILGVLILVRGVKSTILRRTVTRR